MDSEAGERRGSALTPAAKHPFHADRGGIPSGILSTTGACARAASVSTGFPPRSAGGDPAPSAMSLHRTSHLLGGATKDKNTGELSLHLQRIAHGLPDFLSNCGIGATANSIASHPGDHAFNGCRLLLA